MSNAAPTEEAVKLLLDYLVDPMLPLKPEGKKPPSLAHQQSVAKQVHAVVLLYNYYQRKQHPELCFLDYVSFCKLALSLKPALMAYMKFSRQTDSNRSNDLENQLSVTEKAIMDACNISLSLDASKAVPSIETWPIMKVSVLLIDSKKDNCVLLYDSITHGVWSVIEKCLDVSNLDSEILSEEKHANNLGKKTPTNVQSAVVSGFEQHAFSAVKEATGINQSELLVLERHTVYSLSKEKTAAYFYIMQSIQLNNEDFQVPIKDAIESLQGPLFKWIPGSWTHTPVIEYYDILPYAMIMSSWYSREFSTSSSQMLNISSCLRIEENRDVNIAEGELAVSVELGNVKINSSQMLENPCDEETNEKSTDDGNYIDAKSIANETVVTDKSKTVEKEEAQETEQNSSQMLENPCEEKTNEKSTDDGNYIDAKSIANETVVADKSKTVEKEEAQETEQNSSQMLENPCDEETNEKNKTALKAQETNDDGNYIDAKSIANETVVAEKSKTAEKEAQETGQSDKSWDITHPIVKQLENCIGANSSGKEAIGTDMFKRAEKEVDETENSDNLLDIHSTVNELKNCVDVDYIGEETIDTDNFSGVVKDVEDTEKFDAFVITNSAVNDLRSSTNTNSSDKETLGVDSSKRSEEVVEDTGKSNKSCDAVHLTVKKLSNDVSEDSKENPTNELQISSFPPGKREKLDEDGIIMDFHKNGDKNKNADVPIRVYHHKKRKLNMKSDACSSAGGSINVGTAGTPKSNAGEIGEGKVAGNGINWTTPSNINGTQVVDCAPASFEPNDRSIETLQATLSAKNIALTQTALGVLFHKRAKLCHQLRHIQDGIASCDRNIQKILEGNKDALALKLDAIMDGCNDTCFSDKTQDESCHHGEGLQLIQSTRGKRISDAILNLRSASEDLNNICRENNWTAIYNMSAPDGGFQAKITVEGMDFDCSCWSELLSTPQEARESAATQIIAQLQAMAGHS